MSSKIILIYCLCDDFLSALGANDDNRALAQTVVDSRSDCARI